MSSETVIPGIKITLITQVPDAVIFLLLHLSVDILLKATGDAPIMKTRKWAVDRTKKIGWIIDFIRKYIKGEPSDSLVSVQCAHRYMVFLHVVA